MESFYKDFFNLTSEEKMDKLKTLKKNIDKNNLSLESYFLIFILTIMFGMFMMKGGKKAIGMN